MLDSKPQTLDRSLFMAYYSFNEADADARDKINKHTLGFGRILIALHHKKNGRYGGWGAVRFPGTVRPLAPHLDLMALSTRRSK